MHFPHADNPLLIPTGRQGAVIHRRLSERSDVVPVAQIAREFGITRQSVYGLIDRYLGRLDRAGFLNEAVEAALKRKLRRRLAC